MVLGHNGPPIGMLQILEPNTKKHRLPGHQIPTLQLASREKPGVSGLGFLLLASTQAWGSSGPTREPKQDQGAVVEC